MKPVVAKFQEVMVAVSAGAQWFSVLDLSNAFFAIPLSSSTWHKFTFTFGNAQYTFTNKTCNSSIISYVDDILITTTTRKENLEGLESVLQKIQQTDFLISPVKAELEKKKVAYLGIELDEEGRRSEAQCVELI